MFHVGGNHGVGIIASNNFLGNVPPLKTQAFQKDCLLAMDLQTIINVKAPYTLLPPLQIQQGLQTTLYAGVEESVST